MKGQTQKQRLISRISKAGKFGVVQDPKLDELEDLINQRNYITRKIRNLPRLEQRLRIEKPDISMDQLVDRLQKRKSVIDKALTKYGGSSKSKQAAFPTPRNWVIAERAPASMTLQEILERQRQSMHPELPDFSGQQDWTPTTFSGKTRPVLLSTGSAIAHLNNDSSADYAVDDGEGYFPSPGVLNYVISAWLNDDASIWRDDNPDRITWYDFICYELPAVQFNSTILTSFRARFLGEIKSQADDYNRIRQYVTITATNADGVLPPLSLYRAGEMITYEGSENPAPGTGVIGLPASVDSGWVEFGIRCYASEGVSPLNVVLLCTELRAQDGVLQIIGNWEITDLRFDVSLPSPGWPGPW